MPKEYAPLKPGDRVFFTRHCVNAYFGQDCYMLVNRLEQAGLMCGADYIVQKAGKPEKDEKGVTAQSIQIMVDGRMMTVNSAFFERE